MSSTISQLACFSSISRATHLRTRSFPCPFLRPKVLVIRSSDGRVTNVSTSENKSYSVDASGSHDGSSVKLNPATEAFVGGNETSEPVQEQNAATPKRAAMIHDFCFGIPYGGLVLCGALVDFIFSRDLSTLGFRVLFGFALLKFSTDSLNAWRQGKSSLLYILGQGVSAAFFFLNNLGTYLKTKKIFPTGFYAAISAAMLCFYFYVVVAGGNPPPKKSKQSAVAST